MGNGCGRGDHWHRGDRGGERGAKERTREQPSEALISGAQTRRRDRDCGVCEQCELPRELRRPPAPEHKCLNRSEQQKRDAGQRRRAPLHPPCDPGRGSGVEQVDPCRAVIARDAKAVPCRQQHTERAGRAANDRVEKGVGVTLPPPFEQFGDSHRENEHRHERDRSVRRQKSAHQRRRVRHPPADIAFPQMKANDVGEHQTGAGVKMRRRNAEEHRHCRQRGEID